MKGVSKVALALGWPGPGLTDRCNIDVLHREKEHVDSHACIDAILGEVAPPDVLRHKERLLPVCPLKLGLVPWLERSGANGGKRCLKDVDLTASAREREQRGLQRRSEDSVAVGRVGKHVRERAEEGVDGLAAGLRMYVSEEHTSRENDETHRASAGSTKKASGESGRKTSSMSPTSSISAISLPPEKS